MGVLCLGLTRTAEQGGEEKSSVITRERHARWDRRAEVPRVETAFALMYLVLDDDVQQKSPKDTAICPSNMAYMPKDAKQGLTTDAAITVHLIHKRLFECDVNRKE